MRDLVKELTIERDELSSKLEKLTEFLDGDIYNTLTESYQCALVTQSTIMGSYVNILNTRIKLLVEGKVTQTLSTDKYNDNFDMAEERKLNNETKEGK